MRKLKLHLHDLAVESFEPSLQRRATGTVHAHDDVMTTTCPQDSVDYSCVDRTCVPECVTGYPDPCWISWDPAARCKIPQ
jgi:hypothetical protein